MSQATWLGVTTIKRIALVATGSVLIILAVTVPWLGIDWVEGPAVALAATGFSDVPPEHWAAGAIADLTRSGVLKGVGDGVFQPERAMTRAEFVTALLRARGLDPAAQAAVDPALGGHGYGAGSRLFSDVPGKAWFLPGAVLAHRLAITEGLGDGRFGPNQPVTREELAAMTVQAVGWGERARTMSWSEAMRTLKTSFTDWEEVSEAARPYIALAVSSQLLKGFPDHSLAPGRTCSRAEAAVILLRAGTAAPPPTSMVSLPATGTSTSSLRIPSRRELTVTATAYGPNPIDNYPWSGDLSYTGIALREGIIAVDPSVIPLGTHVYVEGYGYAVAADVGGAIKGSRIDLLIDKPREQILKDFGMRQLRVWIVD